MTLLYNLGIRGYALAIWVSSFFNPKARSFRDGRKHVLRDIREFRNREKGKLAWFHAASLGEFEQGLPVMEAFKREFPSYSIVVTFFSPSGYELRKNHPIADFTTYLPLDTHKNAKHFIKALNPSIAVFIKYEYWHHYLKALNTSGIPLYSISALFTPQHIFFKKYGSFHRAMLKHFEHTFVQNASSLKLLTSIGIINASVSGDTRFDRVKQTIAHPKAFSDIAAFAKNYITLIIGSAWPEDMAVLNDFINKNAGDIRFIIAPHLVDDGHVKKLVAGLEKPFQLYTQSNLKPETPIIILNTMGMLSSIYQYGDVAYIGGAFGDGLHNILEAVAFGLPVVFGNKGLEKFPESGELIALGGAFSVENAEGTQQTLSNLLNKELREEASRICKTYVEENAGATEKIISHLKHRLQ